MQGVCLRGVAYETEKVFRKIAKQKYRELTGDDFIVGMWLSGMLDESNPMTGYVWRNDIDRKRQYFTESIMSGEPIDKAVKKALRYWYGSQKQYADIITDAAAMQAFEDMNTVYVQWNTADDCRVCSKCLSMDGHIYPINHAPIKPHYGCRCYFTRVD